MSRSMLPDVTSLGSISIDHTGSIIDRLRHMHIPVP
jgi:hypothetical protein